MIRNLGKVKKDIEKNIEYFVSTEKKKDKKYINKIRKDIWRCRELFLIDANEYFLFKFEELSDEERYQFVGNRERMILLQKINTNEAWKLFKDKYKTYKKFEHYFKRKVIQIKGIEDKEEFINICKGNDRLIVKELNGLQGKRSIYY